MRMGFVAQIDRSGDDLFSENMIVSSICNVNLQMQIKQL